jgi:hypothetical protein
VVGAAGAVSNGVKEETMSHATELLQTSNAPLPVGADPPAGTQANPSGVYAKMVAAPLGGPSIEEAEAAVFRSREDANRAVEAVVAAGLSPECVAVLADPAATRNFMKQYVHRDNDRATHAAAGMVFFGAAGAAVMGLLFVIATNWLWAGHGAMAPIIAALLGGVVGAVLGGIFGGLALRTADDRSMEMVDNLAQSGPVVAVVPGPCGSTMPLAEIGRILSRHNGLALRLRQHVSLADLHPGDTRVDQPSFASVEGARAV